MSAAAGFAEKARILKLAEQIQARLFHAQQVKLSGQQSVNPQVSTRTQLRTAQL